MACLLCVMCDVWSTPDSTKEVKKKTACLQSIQYLCDTTSRKGLEKNLGTMDKEKEKFSEFPTFPPTWRCIDDHIHLSDCWVGPEERRDIKTADIKQRQSFISKGKCGGLMWFIFLPVQCLCWKEKTPQ